MFRSSILTRIALLSVALLTTAACLYQRQHSIHAQAQPAAAFTAKDFAGTWNWMFRDKRFATMTLEQNGDHFTGSMTNGSINMDKDGKITNAIAIEGSSPIVSAYVEKGVLRLSARETNEGMEMTMSLTSPTSAELRFVGEGAPPNGEAIRLEKVWSEPPLRP